MEIRDRCDRMLRRVRPSVREVFAYCEACVIAFPDSVKSTVFWVTIILHHEVCFQHVPVIRQETSVITTRMTRSDIRHHTSLGRRPGLMSNRHGIMCSQMEKP